MNGAKIESCCLVEGAKGAKLPELLAPAGDWNCLRAAVENGADAVYFGLSFHNARLRAENFSLEQLPGIMEFLHLRGVKGYVTLNTLIFTDELDEVAGLVEKIIKAGADAVLVQDIGLCRVIRQISPDFPVHASTQMTITSADGARIAKELGCNRIVVARECSLEEVKRIKELLGDNCPELEIFIHGALCVAYSGQCLTSESLGGRSANRGECAQACRLPYELICDGKRLDLGEQRYLLSPKDLVGYEMLEEIVKAGICSIKIEGRLKSPEYVANITRIYRDALDSIGGINKRNQNPQASANNSVNVWYRMQMAFSRGLYTGWLKGIDNQQLVHARFGKKRGVFLGTVIKILNNKAVLKLESNLSRGDGVVFDCGRPDLDEEGGRVYEIFSYSNQKIQTQKPEAKSGEFVAIAFGDGDVDFNRIHIGDRVWKTSDPALERELRSSFNSNIPNYKRPLKMSVSGSAGEKLRLCVEDELGNRICVDSDIPLSEANQRPLDEEVLREQLGRLGSTQFFLSELKNHLVGRLIIPFSELNRIRRSAIKQLEDLRKRPTVWQISNQNYRANFDKLADNKADKVPVENPQLIVLVRNLEQFCSALKCDVGLIYCDFEDIRKYEDAVSIAKNESKNNTATKIYVCPPRIFKDGEEGVLKKVRQCNADGFVVRNFAQLEFFNGLPCVCDFSLNIANPISAEFLMNRWRPQRITVSYDLNIPQILDMLKSAPPEWFEITLHQHMPMFYMEYCLFCKFLSSGSNWRDCGRPCEKYELKLRDRVGAEHPIKADIGCRNTVYNALAQTGAEFFDELVFAGARWFRIEFVNETFETVALTIRKYRALLENKISGKDLWKELKVLNQIGVTRGQLMKNTDKKGYAAVSWG